MSDSSILSCLLLGYKAIVAFASQIKTDNSHGTIYNGHSTPFTTLLSDAAMATETSAATLKVDAETAIASDLYSNVLNWMDAHWLVVAILFALGTLCI